MDNPTLAVALTLFLLIQSIGFYLDSRRKRRRAEYRFILYAAAALLSGALGFAALQLQDAGARWAGIVAFNALIFLYDLLSLATIRAQAELRAWPRRFWAYLGLLVAAFVAFTYAVPQYSARILVVEGFFVLTVVDQFASLFPRRARLDRGVRIALVLLYGAFGGVSLARIAATLAAPLVAEGSLIDARSFTALLLLGFVNFVAFSFLAKTLLHGREQAELVALHRHDVNGLRLERDQNEEMRRLFQVSPYLILVTDAAGRFLQYNQAWTSILGYTPERLQSSAFFDFIHPDDLERTQAVMGTLRAQSPLHGFVNRYFASDGSVRFIEWNADPYGERIYGSGRDVTARVRQMDALQADLRIKEQHIDLMRARYPNVDALLDRALRTALDVTNGQRAFLYDCEAGAPSPAFQRGIDADGSPVPASEADRCVVCADMWEEVVRNRKSALRTAGPSTAPASAQYAPTAPGPDGSTAPGPDGAESHAIAVPVVSEGETAALVVLTGRDAPFGDADVLNVELLMSTVWPAVERMRLNETLAGLAVMDRLTGLHNRHYLEQRIEEEIARADRYDREITLVMLDIDHFKAINDRYGHPAGDQVLVALAGILRDSLRISDLSIRFGGEEFALVLPDTGLEAGVRVSERIRRTIEAAHVPSAGRFTASFGVAVHRTGESYQDWYRRVDRALYDAKYAGRNRIGTKDD